jgi:putative ABC transport system permease protein
MGLGTDLRHALRGLAAERAWTAIAVCTLALGIGANAAIFAVVDAALLRPLPFADPDRLMAVWGLEAGSGPKRQRTSYPDFRDFQQSATASFEGFAAYRPSTMTLTAADQDPMRVETAVASREMFGVLRAAPLLGRTFSGEEDRAGGPGAVILSEALWRERWGASRDAVGRTVTLDGEPHTVIGVMPASFGFPAEARLWTPAGREPRNEFRGIHQYRLVARLRPGVPLSVASSEMMQVAGRLASVYPDDNAGRTALVEPLQRSLVGEARPALLMLLGAVVLVLLITCANFAALLVARSSRRGRELAVRISLGATPGRLARQLLTEAALVSFLGALAALAVASWLVPVLVALAPPDLPRLQEVVFDRRVALVCLAVTILTACLFGAAPALLASRVQPAEVLRAESGRASAGPARQRLRQALTLAQTALAVVLLIGTGLLVRSLSALHRVDPGFNTSGVVAAEVYLPESRYPTWRDWETTFAAIRDRVAALPGIQSAAVASGDPFYGGFGARFGIEGRPPFEKGHEPEPAMRMVSADFMRTTGIRLLRGRDLSPADRAGAPGAVLINEAMARRYFPGEDPVGRRLLRKWWSKDMPEAWEIVGIVGDVKTASLEGDPDEAIYFPSSQVSFASMTLVARTARTPDGLAPEIGKAVRSVDPLLATGRVRAQGAIVTESMGSRRFNASLLGVFAGLAMLLSAIGLYGVLSYAVAQRGHEIAVRRALGARTADIVLLVSRPAARVAAAGLAIGIAGAVALAHALRAMLFGVRPLDPLTLVAVAAAVLVASAAASLGPLARALTVDPARALRGE